MSTPVEIFERVCFRENTHRFFPIPNNLSHIFDSHHLMIEEQIAELKSMFMKGCNIDIYVDFAAAPDLNAVATIEEYLGIVAIWKGSVLLPKDSFQRMLSHPGILTTIGDSGTESIACQFGEGLATDVDELHRQRRQHGRPEHPPIPKDEMRRAFAIAATQFAFDFLVIHELAHIVVGHLGFMKSKGYLAYILEAAGGKTDKQQSEPPNIVRQAVEYGADTTAVGITIEKILSNRGLVQSRTQDVFPGVEQQLAIWCFAINVFFRLWGISIDINSMDKGKYPPTAMRFSLAINLANTLLRKMRPDLNPSFLDISNYAFTEANDAIIAIGGSTIQKCDLDPVFSAEGQAHHARIRNCWFKEIVPELKAHSYVPIPDLTLT
jgi:hypothetical protein